jgi:hypothetical protein
VPYIPLEDVSFLKRKFVDHEAFPGMKVAALDRESIYKMLLYTIPSKSVTPEEQFASAFASAQAEAFFHGKAFFEQVRQLIDDIPKSAELHFRMSELPRPTWYGMIKRFVNASPKLQASQLVPGFGAETDTTEGSYCQPTDFEYQTGWRVDPWGSTTMGRSPEECFYTGVRLSSTKAHKLAFNEYYTRVENSLLTKNYKKETTHTTQQEEDLALAVVAKAIKTVRAKKYRRDKERKWEGFQFQADIAYDTASMPTPEASASHDVVQETTVFKNEPISEVLDVSGKFAGLGSGMAMT